MNRGGEAKNRLTNGASADARPPGDASRDENRWAATGHRLLHPVLAHSCASCVLSVSLCLLLEPSDATMRTVGECEEDDPKSAERAGVDARTFASWRRRHWNHTSVSPAANASTEWSGSTNGRRHRGLNQGSTRPQAEPWVDATMAIRARRNLCGAAELNLPGRCFRARRSRGSARARLHLRRLRAVLRLARREACTARVAWAALSFAAHATPTMSCVGGVPLA